MTRIIAGSAGGRALRTPPGAATRPTADRVREALFSTVESLLGTVRGRSFLDVYAGSGAVGLEAASRGADPVLLVERLRTSCALIRANAQALGLSGARVVAASAASAAADPPAAAFDIVFADPPYDHPTDEVGSVLGAFGRSGWLAPGALVAVERGRRLTPWEWPGGFAAERERCYGDTLLCYAWWSKTAVTDRAPEGGWQRR